MKMVNSSKGVSFEIIGGNGMDGFKDGFGTSAQFKWPLGMSSSKGILFLADGGNSAIRQLNLSDSNRVKTISGAGKYGNRNGYALHAQYYNPNTVGFFNDSLYIVDQDINCIRMLKVGIVTTVAGPGAPIYLKESIAVRSIISPKAIACLNSQFCFVANSKGNAVLKMSFGGFGQLTEFLAFAGNGSPGWMDGIGISAMLNNPTAIAIDMNMNRLLVSDTDNHLIRSIDISSGAVSTIAGTGYSGIVMKIKPLECTMNLPRGLAIDPISHVVFVADSGNHCILAFSLNNNTMVLYAGVTISPGFVNGKS
jgi:DNA-binding beta-propeller fold protein YncE